jgi:hypothetical protein
MRIEGEFIYACFLFDRRVFIGRGLRYFGKLFFGHYAANPACTTTSVRPLPPIDAVARLPDFYPMWFVRNPSFYSSLVGADSFPIYFGGFVPLATAEVGVLDWNWVVCLPCGGRDHGFRVSNRAPFC